MLNSRQQFKALVANFRDWGPVAVRRVLRGVTKWGVVFSDYARGGKG